MIPILEDAILGSHLDCQNFDLLKVRAFTPVPTGLAQQGDAMDGPRTVLSGSVFNYHVSSSAKIDQEKLALNGLFPTDWFYVLPVGEEPELTQRAARGDLSEFVSRKGVANGYAPLDSSKRLPASVINPGAGLGTVSAVKLSMVPELTVGGTNPIEASGSFDVSWANAPDNSWFGVFGVGLNPILKPSFLTKTLPSELIPDLDAAKFVSGMFPVEQLPIAIGMAVDHRSGILPDPGETGDSTQYIGRDMKWHAFTMSIAYQPTVPDLNIYLSSVSDELAAVTIRSPLKGSFLFYRVNGGNFIEVHQVAPSSDVVVTISGLEGGSFIEAYASKAGYNNSPIASYQVPLTAVNA